MIEALSFEKIDQVKWDKCIKESYRGNIYGLYDSICKACENWIGIIYNNYEAVMALPIKKKLGLTYSWHPQFIGPLGIYSVDEHPEMVHEIFAKMLEHSWWIKMYYFQNEEENKSIKFTERIYQELHMTHQHIDQIRFGYNENTKRNIKKAVKQNLSLRSVDDVELVIQTFKQHKGNQIKNIDEDSYIHLKKLMSHWLEKKLGHIKAVYDGEKLAAIGYFLVWKDTIIYYKGAVTKHGKSNGAMHFLIDQEMEQYAGRCRFFDFGGSNTDSVAQFYRGFGGVNKSYYLHEYKKFKI